ncbi:hypothetical protein CB1_002383002 [Camelus ferus]|nr:hypothetical protein CB1_002383002 [Camelus ferus]
MGQLFLEHLFGGSEVFLLVVCILLLLVAWGGGFLHSVVQLLFVYSLPFCGPNVINYFICDMYPLLELACTDTHLVGFTVVANGGAIYTVIFILLLTSYGVIQALIFKDKGKTQELDMGLHVRIFMIIVEPFNIHLEKLRDEKCYGKTLGEKVN